MTLTTSTTTTTTTLRTQLLRPELISLLSKSHRVLDLIQMAEMYGKLGKMDLLKEEYIAARPAALHRVWFSYGPSDVLVEWLPEFHEQVLAAIGEERRRCVEIFSEDEGGSSVACGVATAVLEPIIASFAQRLAEKFNLPQCNECYLQTLSFVLKSLVELEGSEEVSVEKFMKASVAPFIEFQRRLGLLEKEHLNSKLESYVAPIQTFGDMAQEDNLVRYIECMHAAVSSVVGEGKQSIIRILTFSGGTQTAATCDGLKSLFSSTIEKFSSSIEALRKVSGVEALTTKPRKAHKNKDNKKGENSANQPEVEPPPTFEWRCLHSALRVLAIAGRWQRGMIEFENYAVGTLRPLYPLLFPSQHGTSLSLQHGSNETTSSLSKLVLEAFKGLKVSSDDISMQNLALSLSRKYLLVDEGQSKELRALLLGLPQTNLLSSHPSSSSSSSSIKDAVQSQPLTASSFNGALFVYSLREALNFSATCRQLVFDVTMRNIRSSLDQIPKLDAWCGKTSPAYSIQPSAHVTRVGEHLLSLYQELEMFARDETARTDVAVNDLSPLTEVDWKKLSTLLPLTEAETSSLTDLASARSIKGIALQGGGDGDGDDNDDDDDDDAGDEGGEGEEEDEEEKAVAAFCNEWLLVAVRSTYAIFISKLLAIPKVDECGLSQLSADLDYLLNVTSALGLDKHALADHMSQLFKLSREQFSESLNRKRPRSCGAQGGVVRKIETQFAGVRGVAVVFSASEEK
jgi:hypothetical protein